MGATASTSAKFAVLNVNSGTPTASVSAGAAGGAYLNATGTLSTTVNQTLALGASGTGEVQILPGGTLALIARGANLIGAGTLTGLTGLTSSGTITFSGFTSNGGPLYTNGSGVLAQVTAGTTTQVLHGGTTPSFSAVSLTADVSGILPTANGGSWWDSSSGALYPGNLTMDLLIGGNASTSARFRATGNSAFAGTTSSASVSGKTSFASLVVDNSGVGDIFTASASGLNRFVIQNNGNVGIGTTNPGAKLEIAGVAPVGHDDAIKIGVDGEFAASIKFFDDDGESAQNFKITFSAATEDLRFQSDAVDNILYLTDGGNVGIGTATPLTALDVTGSASLSANLNLKGAGTAHTFNILDNGTLNFQRSPGGDAGTTTVLYLGSNSNVGLGTASPLETLDVRGTATVSGNLVLAGAARTIQTTANNLLTIGGNTTGNITISPLNGGAGGIINLNATDLQIAGTAGSTIATASCVTTTDGIVTGSASCPGGGSSNWTVANGTIRPNQATVLDLLLGGDASTSAKFAVLNVNSGTTTASLSATTTGLSLGADGTIQSLRNANLTVGGSTTGTIILNPLNATGRVGINNSVPLATLDVTGSASLSANLSLRGAGTAHTFNILDNGTLNFQRSPGGDAGTTTVMYLGSNGAIGVGTTSPDTTFEISESAGGNMSFETTDSDVISGDDLGTIAFRGVDSGVRPGALIRAEANATWGASANEAGTTLRFFLQDNSTTDRLGQDVMRLSNSTSGFPVLELVPPANTGNATLLGPLGAGGELQLQSTNTKFYNEDGGLRMTVNTAVVEIDTADLLIDASQTATTNGLCHSGANSSTTFVDRYVVACSGAPTDIAEWYPAKELVSGDGIPEAGDVVATTVETANYEEPLFNPRTGQQTGVKAKRTVSILAKSTKAYESQIIGIVSESPNQVLGEGLPDQFSNSIPVALVGRVPVKVSLENGTIKVGDFLTSSSIPGVAMKATKRGQIVGKALDNFDGGTANGEQVKIGKVMTFVNLTWYDPAINIAANGNLSAIGLITPKVTTDVLTANIIKPSTNSDLVLNLTTEGKFIIKGDTGEDAVSFDNKGNAFFKGKLTADKIKANSIEGLEIITNRLASLDSNIATLDATFMSLTGQEKKSSESGATDYQGKLPKELSLESLNVEGMATISASLRVKQNGLIEGILNVVDTITANNLIVTGVSDFFKEVVFRGDVEFRKHATFNKDMAGIIIIHAGADQGEVQFEKEYEQTPIITATLSVNDAQDNDPIIKEEKQSQQEKTILENRINYIVTRQTSKGFVIKLNKTTDQDIKFTWVALSVKDAKVYESSSNSASLSAQLIITPTPGL